ncbi:hypothetical protein HUW51_10905 [Adhaeribacter swui]|uniref:Uncharacterized protein n=1 Tax=Adhaeribacter swui TaxID=2086471 RepID=A0A7G7G7S7_9BACT|nr:DUF6157 family protein [Adhaeribacter swui]QNF33211.1 hypothetical protein HUW51_10905 [Adhaeribacter swui]
MKIYSTNYQNTFIKVADDCPAANGETPPVKGDTKTVASMQFDLVSKNPYQFTSDEVFFQVFADRSGLTPSEYPEARARFFSKGQPCFRASPLAKRYGWGIHSDQHGKVALYGCETPEYEKLANNPALTVVKAMRTSK